MQCVQCAWAFAPLCLPLCGALSPASAVLMCLCFLVGVDDTVLFALPVETSATTTFKHTNAVAKHIISRVDTILLRAEGLHHVVVECAVTDDGQMYSLGHGRSSVLDQ